MFLEEDYLMWLSRVEGVSLKKKEQLITHFGSAKGLFYADIEEIENFSIPRKINHTNIIDIKDENILNGYIRDLYKKEIKFVSKYHMEYPRLLKNIQDPPLVIYFIGELPDVDLQHIAIIGSRRCTQYGALNSYKFGKSLASLGFVIVSGMAMGIDSMAHKGAIDGGGKTIAILGCGVDIVYPISNRTLRDNIIKNGCVISEYPPETPAFPTNFPARNRIVSGVSDAIIVVEAAKRSGTLITVGQALDQGREVFSIPGNIGNTLSEGTNKLIKLGAHPLTDVEDIIEILGNDNKSIIEIKEKEKKINELLAPEEKLVYDCISELPITLEEIVFKTEDSIQKVQFALSMLELKGYIKRLAGQKYIKNI